MWNTSFFTIITLIHLCYQTGHSKHVQVKKVAEALRQLTAEKNPELELIERIINEDYEILDEKEEIEAGEGLSSTGPWKKKGIKVKLPSYLETLDEYQLSPEDEESVDNPVGSSDGTLARVWLPLEIKESESIREATTIHFQQTMKKELLSNFTKAEIILTMKPDAALNDNGEFFLRMIADGVSESKTLFKSIKYYAFNITEYLQTHLLENLQHPHPLEISFQVFQKLHKPKSLTFDALFDIQVDRPFIMFTYRNFPEEILTKKENRKRRSVTDPFQQTLESDLALNSLSLEPTNNHLDEEELQQPQASITEAPASTPQSNETDQLSQNINSTGETITVPVVTPSHHHLDLCRKVTWVVSPGEVEMPIVAPRLVELNYCSGKCPFPLQNDHFNYTLHSFFIDRHRLRKVFNVPKDFPHSCCVPIKYRTLTVWMKEDETSFVRRIVNDSVVDQCGCR